MTCWAVFQISREDFKNYPSTWQPLLEETSSLFNRYSGILQAATLEEHNSSNSRIDTSNPRILTTQNNQILTNIADLLNNDLSQLTGIYHVRTKKGPGLPAGAANALTFFETLIHLLKGNLGAGLFAMGDAFKNAGLLVGVLGTTALGLICIYNNHILVSGSRAMKKAQELMIDPTFPETISYGFAHGSERFQRFSKISQRMVVLFIGITQIGFCCVYIVLVSSSLQTVVNTLYDMHYDIRVCMAVIFPPILLGCLIRTLKFLAPISLVSNILLFYGIILTFCLSAQDLPPLSSRRMVAPIEHFPLFFGTVVFSFEGIALVIPLRSEMRNPKRFDSLCGVLNIGMCVVMSLLIVMGFLAYLKFGDEISGSVTLNLPSGHLAESVRVSVGLAIMLTYPLQFYVAVTLLFGLITSKHGPFKRPVLTEYIFRTVCVCLTFILAALIPHLHLFISLIGAVSSSALALIFPALCDYCLRYGPGQDHALKPNCFRLSMILLSVFVGVAGAILGTFVSLRDIINAFRADFQHIFQEQ